MCVVEVLCEGGQAKPKVPFKTSNIPLYCGFKT